MKQTELRITHFGHACVLIELEGARVLIDPGTYSEGFEVVRGLDAILVTHIHPDHLDPARLVPLRERNPEAILVGNRALTAIADIREADLLVDGSGKFFIGRLEVQAFTSDHEQIHPEVPSPPNTGFVLGRRIWHPGDSLRRQGEEAEVLLLPIAGPWMRLADAVSFARAAGTSTIVPIHEAGLAEVHRNLHLGVLTKLAPEGVAIRMPKHGKGLEL